MPNDTQGPTMVLPMGPVNWQRVGGRETYQP